MTGNRFTPFPFFFASKGNTDNVEKERQKKGPEYDE